MRDDADLDAVMPDWLRHLRPERRIRFVTCCAECGEQIDTMYVHAGEGLCRACFAAVLVAEEQQSEPQSLFPPDEPPDEGEGGAEKAEGAE